MTSLKFPQTFFLPIKSNAIPHFFFEVLVEVQIFPNVFNYPLFFYMNFNLDLHVVEKSNLGFYPPD